MAALPRAQFVLDYELGRDLGSVYVYIGGEPVAEVPARAVDVEVRPDQPAIIRVEVVASDIDAITSG